VLDSAVLIDNFRWEIETPTCPDGTLPPCTIERERGPRSQFVTAPVGPVVLSN